MSDFKDAALIAALETHVRRAIGKEINLRLLQPGAISVVHVSESDDMVMYFTKMKLPRLDVADAVEVLQKLDMFCMNEDEGFDVGERNFLLGDGDDSSAVWLEDGHVHIWLRHWQNSFRGL